MPSLSSLNITRIMIAHRAQSVAAAGRVLVVADGQIQPMRFQSMFAIWLQCWTIKMLPFNVYS